MPASAAIVAVVRPTLGSRNRTSVPLSVSWTACDRSAAGVVSSCQIGPDVVTRHGPHGRAGAVDDHDARGRRRDRHGDVRPVRVPGHILDPAKAADLEEAFARGDLPGRDPVHVQGHGDGGSIRRDLERVLAHRLARTASVRRSGEAPRPHPAVGSDSEKMAAIRHERDIPVLSRPTGSSRTSDRPLGPMSHTFAASPPVAPAMTRSLPGENARPSMPSAVSSDRRTVRSVTRPSASIVQTATSGAWSVPPVARARESVLHARRSTAVWVRRCSTWRPGSRVPEIAAGHPDRGEPATVRAPRDAADAVLDLEWVVALAARRHVQDADSIAGLDRHGPTIRAQRGVFRCADRQGGWSRTISEVEDADDILVGPAGGDPPPVAAEGDACSTAGLRIERRGWTRCHAEECRTLGPTPRPRASALRSRRRRPGMPRPG